MYFHHDDAVDWPRNEVMKHMLFGSNIGLICNKQVRLPIYNHVIATAIISEHHLLETANANPYHFPLYLYNFPEDGKPKVTLFEEDNLFNGKDRVENFTPEFRKFIDDKYGKHYEPEQILGYIYAVLHSPTYRSKYTEALKNDFPRIPFVDDIKTFEGLSELGWQLVQAHLLKEIPAMPEIDINKGNMQVEKPVYDEKQQRLYINKDQYFSPVPQDVWEFYIGGYQVLDKYLKSRKGRELTLDEIENVQSIVKVLAFTIRQMQKIDEVWKP